jgi:hypothetical protein
MVLWWSGGNGRNGRSESGVGGPCEEGSIIELISLASRKHCKTSKQHQRCSERAIRLSQTASATFEASCKPSLPRFSSCNIAPKVAGLTGTSSDVKQALDSLVGFDGFLVLS